MFKSSGCLLAMADSPPCWLGTSGRGEGGEEKA